MCALSFKPYKQNGDAVKTYLFFNFFSLRPFPLGCRANMGVRVCVAPRRVKIRHWQHNIVIIIIIIVVVVPCTRCLRFVRHRGAKTKESPGRRNRFRSRHIPTVQTPRDECRRSSGTGGIRVFSLSVFGGKIRLHVRLGV